MRSSVDRCHLKGGRRGKLGKNQQQQQQQQQYNKNRTFFR